MTKVKPHKKRILVEPIQPTCDARAFIIPERYRDTPTEGIVVEIGTGITGDHGIKLGDRVLYERYTGTEVMVDGAKLKLLEVNDITAIIEQTNN